MKIYAKIDPQSDPKINVWALRDPTFEVFGCVLRNAIFFMIFEVCQNRQKMKQIDIRAASSHESAGPRGMCGAAGGVRRG